MYKGGPLGTKRTVCKTDIFVFNEGERQERFDFMQLTTTYSQLDAAFIKQGSLLLVVTVLFLNFVHETRCYKTLKKLTQTQIW